MAGPCAVESREQAFAAADVVARSGAQFFRGGVFKTPRPQNVSIGSYGEGLEILAEVRNRYGLKIVTEAVDEHTVDLIEPFADVIQISARNMHNFSLLRRAGRSRLPVLLKRGLAATVDEWLLAAEHLMSEGNYNVILCERGIHALYDVTEDSLDLGVIPALRSISHLPLVVDPSHGAGKNHLVVPLARASTAVGVDGLLVEVNVQLSTDSLRSRQELTPEHFMHLVSDVQAIHRVVVNRTGTP